jgi:hypothetical protein
VSRLSLSDVAEMLLAQAERDRAEREQLTGLLKEVVAGLTAPRPVTASESVTIKRAGIGDKPTTIDVSAVVQEGETLEDARRRASIEYEKAAARASTHLRRLGVNPITVARLRGWAEADGVTLAELVRYILGDYRPAE